MDRKALGRGLGALIAPVAITEEGKGESIAEIPITAIRPNPFQPREEFEPAALEELKSSISEKGVIQPIIVRRRPDGYELIAGERRWRATKALGLPTIKAIVKTIDDEEALELSLIENVQREGLNPVEEARGYKYLMEKFGLTQEKISLIVGKSRPAIANALRLLSLPKEIQDAMRKGAVTMGHGRILLEISDMHEQMRLMREIIAQSLSVRELEALAKQSTRRRAVKRHASALGGASGLNPRTYALQETLQHFLGTKVRIAQGRKRGKIEIEFYSLDDLERITKLIRE
jgi:ParB family transcriptional regulator, chromosome partitioning protein